MQVETSLGLRVVQRVGATSLELLVPTPVEMLMLQVPTQAPGRAGALCGSGWNARGETSTPALDAAHQHSAPSPCRQGCGEHARDLRCPSAASAAVAARLDCRASRDPGQQDWNQLHVRS